jgi:hypothetical protein
MGAPKDGSADPGISGAANRAMGRDELVFTPVHDNRVEETHHPREKYFSAGVCRRPGDRGGAVAWFHTKHAGN